MALYIKLHPKLPRPATSALCIFSGLKTVLLSHPVSSSGKMGPDAVIAEGVV